MLWPWFWQVVLEWLWKKHALCTSEEFPPHVLEILRPCVPCEKEHDACRVMNTFQLERPAQGARQQAPAKKAKQPRSTAKGGLKWTQLIGELSSRYCAHCQAIEAKSSCCRQVQQQADHFICFACSEFS